MASTTTPKDGSSVRIKQNQMNVGTGRNGPLSHHHVLLRSPGPLGRVADRPDHRDAPRIPALRNLKPESIFRAPSPKVVGGEKLVR
jgi:hypothetical protein